ncbi:MAG: hypothetical protein LBD90_04855, partial [Bifidobacteriaceae bacterium]|nr:hypothetical protein [Bifidobacteriaceae bacterium]
MPREITMITPEPVTLAHWQVAACAARWASQPRSLLGSELAGAFSARQERDVVLVAAAGLGTVLTAAASARAQVGDEISRLVPEAAAG